MHFALRGRLRHRQRGRRRALCGCESADSLRMSKEKIAVLIVDDSAFMRHALRRMLERDARIEIAGEAGTGEEGVRLTETLHPDVVTMDVEMRGMGGLEALR